jgi:hypothetical protein
MKILLFVSLLSLIHVSNAPKHPGKTDEKEQAGQAGALSDNRHAFEYKTYYNRNRMYKIDYPTFLTMGANSQNADGREFFSSGGGIRLSVYSSYYTETSISSQYYSELNDRSLSISYKVLKPTWYVISGVVRGSGKEFYKKVYYSSTYDEQRTMWLEYPQSRMNDFDIIIPHMVRSFKDL